MRAGDLRHAKNVLSLFFDPLIAADCGNTENFELVRLQENQNCLLVARAGTAGILVNDNFDFLGSPRKWKSSQ